MTRKKTKPTLFAKYIYPFLAQVQVPTEDDDDTTCYILAGVLGGGALFAVVALTTYLLVIKKAKDATVFPTGQSSEIQNTRFSANNAAQH